MQLFRTTVQPLKQASKQTILSWLSKVLAFLLQNVFNVILFKLRISSGLISSQIQILENWEAHLIFLTHSSLEIAKSVSL